MKYQSANDAARRLDVTVRAVQKWAKEGKLKGAHKLGREWLIPIDAKLPDSKTENIDAVSPEQTRVAMPLLNASFETGRCMEYIDSVQDENDREIALGEYYYFSGQPDKAVDMVEKYLYSSDDALRYSASLICLFAGLSGGYSHLAVHSLRVLKEQFTKGLKNSETPTQSYAIGVFTASTAHVLLDIPLESEMPELSQYLRYLPGGIKMQACYVLALQAYQAQNFERALSIADMVLAMSPVLFPISAVYVHVVATMALMKLRRVDEAKARMQKAWELAQDDMIIGPFVEHHGMLQGMIEVFFKKDYPEVFSNIIHGVAVFSDGWRNIHNYYAEFAVTDKLTTTEFIIAMLYGHKWSVKEIASHMQLSPRTVTNHISTIYSKLFINDRKDLAKYVLK